MTRAHPPNRRPVMPPAALLLLMLAPLIAPAETDVESRAALMMLEQVKSRMLTALRDAQGGESELRRIVDDVLVPHVDFHVAAQLVLGTHWRAATAEQRARFIAEFREFVVRFYASALAGYVSARQVPDDFMSFEYTPIRKTPSQMVVRSFVWPPSGQAIPVDYRLHKRDAWRVCDVTVGGISIARNYRAGFDNTIRRAGIDELIADLARNNATAGAP